MNKTDSTSSHKRSSPQSDSADRSTLYLFAILAFVGVLVYLPLAGRMGYYKDDWFLIFDAHTQGAQFFHEIYQIDRPARAYVMQFVYNMFGDRVIYYHLSAYLFRLLASWALFWALDMIWPGHRKPNFLIALLLLIYPGFLSQFNPIDYQAQILSLCLAAASIAFTVRAIKVQNRGSRLAWTGLAILTGIIYPALVEYMLGLEILRLSLIVQLALQENNSAPRETLRKAAGLWLPFLSAPVLFLVWRFFFFETERRATDLGAQFGQLFASPLAGLWWLVNWIQDAFRVVLLAWTVPFYNLAFNLRLKDFLTGMGLAVVVVLLVLIGWLDLGKRDRKTFTDETDPNWKKQILLAGLLTAFIALLPVILVNRHADFGDYSRYTLASAAGAGMIVTVFLLSIHSARWRTALIAILVFAASFTHYANAARAVEETENVRDFWWQVAWRAPDIQPGTTLVASYPVGAIQEDYFIWSPANFIYYPEKQNQTPIQLKLPAAVLTDDVVRQILVGKGEETPLRRGNELTRNFGKVLVMTQASANACVRLIDGSSPDLSIGDPQRILLIASKSKLDNVLSGADQPVPPASIFGVEPEHDWCFYYQKADLARQQGDWEEIVRLGAETAKLGLHPNDQIELMPFLQAYAFLGDRKQVKGLSTRINTQLFYQNQACNQLSSMDDRGYPLSAEMQSYVNEIFCP
ncbi:MAG: hypothetical protein EHM40_09105 [Chloroflexi bacterium]|nr:MAG: hypothetical protein EHM40_09105 [Chloroflexota bacterium]